MKFLSPIARPYTRMRRALPTDGCHQRMSRTAESSGQSAGTEPNAANESQKTLSGVRCGIVHGRCYLLRRDTLLSPDR
jgi:hypothetical protein